MTNLLAAYQQSPTAQNFSTLVTTHINLVYSVARRSTKNTHLAEDITQEVFLLLAKKAPTLNPTTPLAPWLFAATRNIALQSLRAASRRTHHESEAAMSKESPTTPDPLWSLLAEEIDQAVSDLPPADSAVILLRYFAHHSTAQVASALAISEDAAKKRLQRALESLQKLLTSRGFATTTALTLASALTTHAVHAAPPTLAASITTQSATLLTAKGTLMAAAKIKAALAIAAALAVIIIPATIYLSTRTTHTTAPIAESAPTPDPAPTTTPAAPDDYAAAFALRPNQYLTVVNNINPAARAAIYHTVFTDTTNPGALVIRWQNGKISYYNGSNSDAFPLDSIVSHLLNIYSPELSSSLLLPSPKGDIVFREGATPEQYLADLQSILNTYFHRPITCTFENRTMDVIVLSGDYLLLPLPSTPRPRHSEPLLALYINTPDGKDLTVGHSARNPQEFAGFLSEDLDHPVVCEITHFPSRIDSIYSSDVGKNTPLSDANQALFLKHIAEQTNLTVTHESRPVRCLIIKPVDERIDAAAWQGYPKSSPFQVVRWNADKPEIQLDNTWYQLLSVTDIPIEKIVAFAKQSDPKDWQHRFEEDFIALLALMGRDTSSWKWIYVKIKTLDNPTVETRLIPLKNQDAEQKSLHEK